MRGTDLDAVLAIERRVQISPWARLSFEESLTKNNICRVFEFKQEVIAFHVIAQILDEMHVLNLGVSSELQGHGIGHLLIEDIVNLSLSQASKKIFLEVRQGNLKAQCLYQQWQFKQIAIRKNYYRTEDKAREHALVYVRLLGPDG